MADYNNPYNNFNQNQNQLIPPQWGINQADGASQSMSGYSINPYMRQPNSYYQNSVNQQDYFAQTNGINWVLGEAGAKAFLVAPGKSVFLIDREEKKFYIKSADAEGIPTLRKFRFEEIFESDGNSNPPVQYIVEDPNKPKPTDNYVTRAEFDDQVQAILDRIDSMAAKRNNSQKKEK